MGKIERCTLTDEELEALGVEIPAGETDGSFFAWLDEMLNEVMGEDPEAENSPQTKEAKKA